MRNGIRLPALFLALVILLCGCGPAPSQGTILPAAADAPGFVRLSEIPPYAGEPYAAINGGVPFFTQEDLTEEPFEEYSPLDGMGRCGAAFANVCRELMPTEPRGAIGMVKPSGWRVSKYDFIDGKYLYNRCHLIAYCLAGENANERNLITGTRYLNAGTMLPFENRVADYVDATGNHVLYRVTPLFNGGDLLATGVLMEAYSVEDRGEGVCFNVFCYNVQPGVAIDYATGDDRALPGEEAPSAPAENAPEGEPRYIGNRSSMKFHDPDCDGVKDMSGKTRCFFTARETRRSRRAIRPAARAARESRAAAYRTRYGA